MRETWCSMRKYQGVTILRMSAPRALIPNSRRTTRQLLMVDTVHEDLTINCKVSEEREEGRRWGAEKTARLGPEDSTELQSLFSCLPDVDKTS